jgi:hypothetical protein
MLLLVTTAHPNLLRHSHPRLGRLIQPRHYSSIEQTAAAGIPWAADNDAFNGWSDVAEGRYLRMLDRIEWLDGCLWVTVPDVVADAVATMERFETWEPELRRRGLPVALVAQDGLEDMRVPWGRLDALFVGGSTGWKLSLAAQRLMEDAKRRGKLVHVGRVNARRRIQYLLSLGCVDSIDGTTFARWRDRWLDVGLGWVGEEPPGLQTRLV